MRSAARARCLVLSLVVVLVSSLLTVLGLPGSPPPAASAATSDGAVSLLPAAGQFTPLPGTPVLDSRNGTGQAQPDLTPGSTLTLSVTSVGGTPTGVPADASAVVLEFNTLTNFAGVLSAGSAAGATDTSLTFPAGVERNGFDIVTPASDGTIALTITGFAPITTGAVLFKLVVRLHGYYSGASSMTPGSTYVGFDPALLASSNNAPSGFTQNGAGVSGPLTIGGSSYSVQVAGSAGLPADGSATAVAVQVVVQSPTCSGGFALVPDGSARSDWDGAFTAGQNNENFDLVALPSSGQLSLRLLGCSGTATVILRVRGYYSAPTAVTPGSSYQPVQGKVFDTTTGTGVDACPTTADSPQLAAHSGCLVQVLGTDGLPDHGVSAIAAQVVAVNPGNAGWLGLYSNDQVAHTATLWYAPNGRTSNFEVASNTAVSRDGNVYIYNGGDYPVDVVVRVHGYYAAPTLPAAPAEVTAAQLGASSWRLSWTAPTSDGGARLTNYEAAVDSDATTQVVDAATRSVTFSGVASASSHTFRVRAVSGVGEGEIAGPNGTVVSGQSFTLASYPADADGNQTGPETVIASSDDGASMSAAADMSSVAVQPDPLFPGCGGWYFQVTSHTLLHAVHWRYRLSKYWCWDWKQVSTPHVSVAIVDADGTVDDQGVQASTFYYFKWKNYSHSGHYSFRQSKLGICIGGSWGCYAHAHPWIQVYSHDDGTSYWEGHT
ncbi:MAG TPA: fibronectin type III domain-containing protein [Acidobacteriaceae bacterium]|nr:fibronectin type III domain-containing protein [Acidobacteriaceae bacterium]